MSEGKKVPKIRFPGFEGEWEEKKLEEYLIVSKEKNRNDEFSKEEVLSVSGEYGIVNQIAFQGRSFAGESVSNYGVVRTGDVVYTKSPLKSNPYGIIKTNKGSPGIVSTLYAVYKSKENVDSDFIQTYFELDSRMNNYMHPLANKGAKNDMKISDENALKGEVLFPVKQEQKEIRSFISSIDEQTDHIQKEIDKWNELKKGMLQKMFPREGENVPEIRFSGFKGEWEKRKLSEIAEIIGGGTPDTNNMSYWDGNIDWYAPAEMEGQRYLTGSVRKITELGLNKSSAKILPAYITVLFTSRAGIGKMAILQRPAATNQGFQSLVVKEGTDPYFIYTMCDRIKRKAESVASGSTFLEISGKMLGNLYFYFPEINEQKEIASFFRSLDDLIAFYQNELDKWKELKKGLLQQMFV